MSQPSRVSRRTVLSAGAGLAAGLGLVAGCSATGAGSGTGGAAGSGGAGDQGAAAGTATGTALASVSDITVGQAVASRIGRQPVVVARPSADSVVAFSAICTHMGCTVNVQGGMLDCPCHGSQFNALTGAVTRGPATRNLEAIPVRVVDGEVMTT